MLPMWIGSKSHRYSSSGLRSAYFFGANSSAENSSFTLADIVAAVLWMRLLRKAPLFTERARANDRK
jgi:hypothetical protein